MFRNRSSVSSPNTQQGQQSDDPITPPHASTEKPEHQHSLPTYHRHKKTKGIHIDGESGRSGVHPLKFFAIVFRSSSKVSMFVNLLWPTIPIALGFFWSSYNKPEGEAPFGPIPIFTLNYIAMIPAANTVGFAGQELARKLPKTLGIITETLIGSIVELIVFIILISKDNINVGVLRSAILGSILANLLFCLGICFTVGGFLRDQQKFHEAVSEVGTGLLLVAGFGLIIPAAFATVYNPGETDKVLYPDGRVAPPLATPGEVQFNLPVLCDDLRKISYGTAIILIIAFFVYVYFQTTSHHGIYEEVIEADEQRDIDRHDDMRREKLTLIECFIAIGISMAFVALIAYALVTEIDPIVEMGVKEAFMGLILVPLVEKFAEHLTAVDDAYDNQPNVALTHVLGASIQTALLNTPIIVFIAWGLGRQFDLNFQPFESIVLILSIIVVGSFLRDGSSNYLEGMLCLSIYAIIAVCAFFYPNSQNICTPLTPQQESAETGQPSEEPAPLDVNSTAALAIEVYKLIARNGGIPLPVNEL